MKKFEVGQQVYYVDTYCRVELGHVMGGTSSFSPYLRVAFSQHALLVGRESIFPTAAEARNEAVRRAHSIVNRAELARARAMPEDEDVVYWVFSPQGIPDFIWFRELGWKTSINVFAHPTPEAAICAVIPEADRG